MPPGYLGANVSERDLRVARRNAQDYSQPAVTSRRQADRYSYRDRSQRSSSSSSSISSVCSSSEDERRIRKMRGKEFVTAGLAAVATIHAAHGVYSSYESGKKRHKDLHSGKITLDQARKQRNKALMQDAAAVGIAALGLKGAFSEWKEVQEAQHEIGSEKQEREKRHEKRVKRAEREERRREQERRRDHGYNSA